MELNNENHRKRGRPLGSKKKKRGSHVIKVKPPPAFDSSFIKQEPHDADFDCSNPHSEASSSNSNQENDDVPSLTINWTPVIFKEEPLDYTETADCPQEDSKGFVRQSWCVSPAPFEEDLAIRSAECGVHATIEGSENAANEMSDGKRARRSGKKTDCTNCPVCGITLRAPDLEPHFIQEVERLSSIPKKYKKFRNEDGVNNNYVEAKCNRQNRVRAKFDRHLESTPKKIQCPICKDRISGTDAEINDHVECCADNDIIVNVEDEDYESSYEELEIADQTRIRTVSLVPGGYRSLFGSSCFIRNEDSDMDVDVDVDDTKEFGSPQYSELDVITDSNPDDERGELLRRSMISDPDTKPIVLTTRKWSDTPDSEDTTGTNVALPETEHAKNDEPSFEKNNSHSSEEGLEQYKAIIHSLKQRVQFLEKQNKSILTCLICLEPYLTPLVSTICWHVHCEECWLKHMGEKKLCPQCNVIVCPSNLRKIYL